MPALDIEQAVLDAIQIKLSDQPAVRDDTESLTDSVKRIESVNVLQDHLKIVWKNAQSALTAEGQSQTPLSTEILIPWSKPPKRRRRQLIGEANSPIIPRPMRSETRSRLLKGIAQGRIWLESLLNSKSANIQSIAVDNQLSEKSVRSTVSLALLAPDIIEATIEGRLPRNLTVSQMTDLPFDWQEQRQDLELT